MKKLMTIAIAAAAAITSAFTGTYPHSTTYRLDTKASTVEWTGEKVTGKHSGTIMFSSGMLSDNHGAWTGMFEMDMTTINNTDQEPGQGKEKLEGHLKSPDFFDVTKYPKAKFAISSITPLATATDRATHTVKGMLTIKDKTNAVSFDVNMKAEGDKLVCTGAAAIDRTKYDVRYGSKTFFNDIGDKAISDEFSLKFNVVLTK